MKKRVLAILLSLILAVSFTTIAAAEDYIIVNPPSGNNYLPLNQPNQPETEPDYTPEPDNTMLTLQIPIGKIVELGGNTAPKRTTFSFYAFPSDPSYGRYESGGTGLWDVQNCTVSVNGAGTFGCVMTIQIDRRDFFALTDNQGIFVVETDDEQSGWTYDETRWFLQPHYEWSDAINKYEWTGGWDCYNKFEVTEDCVNVNPEDAQGGLGFINTYTENTYKTATLNKTDHFAFLKGYPDGGFAPGKNMSRAEVTTMFARLLTEQMEANKSYPASFSDVTSAHWAANYIGYMEQFGIVRGYSDGTFRPNAPITRAEFAAICCRFEKLTSGTVTFSDVPASHWAAKSIAYAATRGWVTGYADGTFKPGNNITRAEVAAVTCRLLERNADKEYIRAHLKELPRVFADMNEQHWAYWYAMEASNGHDYTKSGNTETWLRTYP